MITQLGSDNDAYSTGLPRFIYRGHAVGAGGDLFPVHAPSSLPVIGGRSQASAPAFPDPNCQGQSELGRLVSWGAVTTTASGHFNQQTRAFETLVTASASDVRLNETFEVASLTAVLESSHPLNRKPGQETAISTPKKGIQIFGLRIFGWPVRVVLHDKLIQVNSSSSVKEMMADRAHGAFMKMQPYEDQGYFFYSLVKSTGWKEGTQPPPRIQEKVSFEGHIIRVQNVGIFFLGEVLRNAGSCRLTLLRARLELPYGEDLSLGLGQRKKMLSFVSTASRESLEQEAKESDVAFTEVESNGLGPPPD